MGNDSSKSNKRKHIYDELNRTIDSFNSNGDYPLSDNEIILKKKNTSKFQTKNGYKIKKHKKIETELNNEIIESSILISDFLTNNLINKKTNRRALPDTNIVNSLLLIPDIFGIEEGMKMNKQMDYCEQIINNGINDCKKDFKGYSKNNKFDDIEEDRLTFIENNNYNVDGNNQEIKDKIISEDNSSEDEKENIKGKDQILFKNKQFKINTKEESDEEDEKNNENSKYNYNNKNQSLGSYLYKPKQIKTNFNKNKFKNIQLKNKKLFSEINSDENKPKIEIGNNKGNYIRKKIYIPHSPKITEFKNRKKEDGINLTNMENQRQIIKNFYNNKITNNNKSKINLDFQNKKDLSVDNIEKKYNNKITNKEIRKRINEDDFKLSNNQIAINKKDYFNDNNKKEKLYDFNITNKDNNIIYTSYNTSNNKTEESSNFNKIDNTKGKFRCKNPLFNNKNNIELESEYRKSKMILNEELNNNEKLINQLNNSSLKDSVNKQAQKIKRSPDYLRNKEIQRKREKSKNKCENRGINRIKNDKTNNYNKNITSSINGGKYNQYNLTNYSNKSKDKEEIKSKHKNKKNNNKENKNKIKSKKNVITIDLRGVDSSDRNKKK